MLIEKPSGSQPPSRAAVHSLWWDVYSGKIDDVRKYLDLYGVDIIEESPGNYTPLIWAAWKGHIDIVALLLERGADINKTGGAYNDKALAYAEQGRHTETAQLLREWPRMLEQPRLAEENSQKNLAAEKQIRDLTNKRLEQLKALRSVKLPLKKTHPHQP